MYEYFFCSIAVSPLTSIVIALCGVIVNALAVSVLSHSHSIPIKRQMATIMQFKNYLRFFSVACAIRIVIMMACTMSACHSFTSSSLPVHMMCHEQSISFQRRLSTSSLYLFRELISNDEEDLRADIAVIREQVGLDEFLKVDDRLCVIK